MLRLVGLFFRWPLRPVGIDGRKTRLTLAGEFCPKTNPDQTRGVVRVFIFGRLFHGFELRIRIRRIVCVPGIIRFNGNSCGGLRLILLRCLCLSQQFIENAIALGLRLICQIGEGLIQIGVD